MITVSSKNMTDNPCDGKIAISVRTSMDPIADFCDGGVKLPVVFVYVNANTPSVSQSYLADNPLYSISDCTECEPDAGTYYQDTGTSDPDTYYYFKGCTLFIRTCTDRQQVTLRTNVNRDFLCDDVGTLVQDVYLDNEYTEGPDFAGTGNNIYTTHGLYMNPTGSQTADIASAYFRTTNLALEENLNGTYTRFWTDNFGTTGGNFGTPQLCELEVVDPPTYYQYEVHKSTSWSPADVCDAPTVQYYILEGEAFRDGTKLYTNQSRTFAPNGWYKDAGTSIAPVPDEPGGEGSINDVYQITNGNGVLNITTNTCGRGGPREIGE